MKKSIILFVTAAMAAVAVWGERADFNVVPQPYEVTVADDGNEFTLGSNAKIKASKGLEKETAFLREYISPLPETKSRGEILLKTGLKDENPEAYKITVSPNRITIEGVTAAGVFYGIQTLRKSLPANLSEAVELPTGEVYDRPRFGYRGAHLDVVRHFFTTEDVKTFIDMLALHNINRFHWHLTDDQGWRIKIDKYQLLTEVGSKRKGTLIGRYGAGTEIDSIPVEGYYTKEEIRDIIDYAADRHIEIIPEVDLPSHMMAALASYPELGCTGGPYEVLCTWAGYKDVLCPGKDSTMQFIADVMNEVMELFPSKYIHIGGDECPKDRWKECQHCQTRIKELGITATESATAEDLLQGYVTSFAAEVARKAGKAIIGWDEILECDIPEDAVVMSWRGTEGAVKGTRRNHRVIQTPNDYLYFDYYQSDNAANEPLAIGGYVPVSRVYEFEPLTAEMDSAQRRLVMGPQANLWTEYVPTLSHLQYMELPRMAALSEVQWSEPENKDFDSFKKRLPSLMNQYKQSGYNYARHIMDTDIDYQPDREKRRLNVRASVYPGTEVRYTLDGTTPTLESNIYDSTLNLEKDGIITSRVFYEDGSAGSVVSDTLRVSPTSFRECRLAFEPYSPFAFGGAASLTDGLIGNDNFRSGRWVGFLGDPCDATIEFDGLTTISEVGFKTCIVWPEGALEMRHADVYGSKDGINYTLLASLHNPEQDPRQTNGAYSHVIKFEPTEVSSLRVVITPCEPSGQWKRILFVDEISAK